MEVSVHETMGMRRLHGKGYIGYLGRAQRPCRQGGQELHRLQKGIADLGKPAYPQPEWVR